MTVKSLEQRESRILHLTGKVSALKTSPTVNTGLATLLMQALTIISGALTARLLGVEGRGAFAACTLVPVFLAAMGDLGGPIATAYLSASDKKISSALARNAVLALAVASPVLITLALILTPSFLAEHESLVLPASIFAGVYIPVQFLGRHLNAIYQGRGEFTPFNLARIASPAINCVVLAVLLVADQASVSVVLLAPAFGSVVFMLVTIPNLRRSWRHKPFANMSLLRRTYAYGAKAQLGAMSPIETFRLDLALVLLLLSTYDAGLYAVAIAAAGLLRVQASTVGLVAVPSIARKKQQSARVETASIYFALTMVLVGVGAVFLAIVARPLVSLVYGVGFIDAVPTLHILIVAMVFAAARQALGDSLRGLGHPGIGSISELSAWIGVVLTLPVLVSRFGASGAAVSVAIAYFCALCTTALLMHWQRLPLKAILNPIHLIKAASHHLESDHAVTNRSR